MGRWQGNKYYIYYEMVHTTSSFETTCMEFNTENELKLNEKKIKEYFKINRFSPVFSFNNAYIIFQIQTVGFCHAINKNVYYSPEIFWKLKSAKGYTIIGKAVKNVKLK